MADPPVAGPQSTSNKDQADQTKTPDDAREHHKRETRHNTITDKMRTQCSWQNFRFSLSTNYATIIITIH